MRLLSRKSNGEARVSSSSPGTERISVRVPPGVPPGAELQFANPRTGNYFKAVVPPGVGVNQTFLVDVPLLSPRPGLSAPVVSPRDGPVPRAQPPPVTYPSYRPVATDTSARTPPARTPPHRQGSVVAAGPRSAPGARPSQEDTELAAAIAASVAEQNAVTWRRHEEEAADRLAALQLAAAVQQSEAEAKRHELSRVSAEEPMRVGQRLQAVEPERVRAAESAAAPMRQPSFPWEPLPRLPSPPSAPPRPRPVYPEYDAASDSPASSSRSSYRPSSSVADSEPSRPVWPRADSFTADRNPFTAGANPFTAGADPLTAGEANPFTADTNPFTAGVAAAYPSPSGPSCCPSGTVASRVSHKLEASLAQQHAECAVCFDDLHASPCAVFRCGSVRVCSHFFHEPCARSLPTKECPLCRTAFEEVEPVPPLEVDPQAWFRCIDVSGDGSLTKAQAIEALLTHFPLEPTRFEAAVEKSWAQWESTTVRSSRSRDNHHASSVITYERFVASRTGLLAFARAHLARASAGPAHNSTPVPDIAVNRLRWFEYFDEDGAGALSQEAVTRGLIKTYGTDLAHVSQVRELVAAVWGLFAEGGAQEGLVTREAFLRPADGLADAIIAGRESLEQQSGSR